MRNKTQCEHASIPLAGPHRQRGSGIQRVDIPVAAMPVEATGWRGLGRDERGECETKTIASKHQSL